MLFQERKYSCGPAALRAALYVMGRVVRESTIRRLADTTTEGTDEYGLFKAIRHYGYTWKEYSDKSPTRAWNRIKRNLNKGMSSLLCISSTEELDHWVAAVGLNGGNVMIFDPENPASKSRKYSGLKVVDIDDFYSKWAYTKNNTSRYYSIVLVK